MSIGAGVLLTAIALIVVVAVAVAVTKQHARPVAPTPKQTCLPGRFDDVTDDVLSAAALRLLMMRLGGSPDAYGLTLPELDQRRCKLVELRGWANLLVDARERDAYLRWLEYADARIAERAAMLTEAAIAARSAAQHERDEANAARERAIREVSRRLTEPPT